MKQNTIIAAVICTTVLFSGSEAVGDDLPAVIKTPRGKVVPNCSYTEEFKKEDGTVDTWYIAFLNAYWTAEYPNATFRGTSTRTYNCHGYAWHMTEGGSAVWIGWGTEFAEEAYMDLPTGDSSYVEVWIDTEASAISDLNAEKVNYWTVDHSAITTTTDGCFISKWGSGPLMEHDYNHCPYDDETDHLYFVPNPNIAAENMGFTVINGTASWIVETLYQTDSFVLEGCNNLSDPWEPLPISIPVRPGRINVEVGSSGFTYFRLVEIETTGHRLIHGTTRSSKVDESILAKRRASTEDIKPTIARLKTQIGALRERAQTGRMPGIARAVPNNARMVIYTTSVLQTAVTVSIADFWTTCGYEVSVELVDGFPADPDGFRSALRTAISNEAQNGATYFLLVGDANDHVEFSQPWPGDWESIRQNRLAAGYPPGGQPEKDLIKTFTIEDSRPRPTSMSWFSPYWFTDQPYGDTNDDGIMDVVVSRLPFTAETEIYAYGAKLWSGATWNAEVVGFMVGNRKWSGDSDSLRICVAASKCMQEVPLWIDIDTLYWTQTSYPDNNAATADFINTQEPDMLVMFSSYSTRYVPGDFMDKTIAPYDWTMSRITTPNIFFVLGASCATADFARTEHPTYGLPVVHEFLAEPNKGSIAWIGPTAGTWQTGNEVVVEYLLDELYRYPFRPAGEAFQRAIQRVLTDYPLESDVGKTARSYVFLGDPMIPFSGVPSVDITVFARCPCAPGLQPTPETAALGCPAGDEGEIVVFLTVDGDELSASIPTESIAIGQPTSGQVVFHQTHVDSPLTLLPDGDYHTTITISHFSGCGLDSVLVTLYGYGVGYAVFRAKSPDLSAVPSPGIVNIVDFAIFSTHYQSTICNCVEENTFSECANYVGDEDPDTTIYLEDLGCFACHYGHYYLSGPASAAPKEVAYSNGSVELVFTEDYPLRGQRKLRASVVLKNVEQYSTMFISFKSENPLFEFSGWHQDGNYPRQTMCTKVTRNGQKEIVLGVMGDKNVSGRFVNLGYFELNVTSNDRLALSSEDFALVTADLLRLDGELRTFQGAQVQRTVQPAFFRNELAQNYPNPFNPTTMIAFSIAKDADVELKIFDVRGSLVNTLVNAHRKKNNYKEIWDGTNNRGNPVASGVYFYRLIAGDFRATKKMVLLR